MKAPARWWESLEEKKVKCYLCPIGCLLKEGAVGSCGVRANEGGKLYTYTYGSLISAAVDPVEKKPLFHFLPGHKTLTIATPGCNLHCKGCQNWEISQIDKREIFENPFYLETHIPPEAIVERAIGMGCKSISYSYSDPTIFAEYMIEVARLAQESGLRNIMVSAGYINPEPLADIDKYMDAYSIDLKFFSDEAYREYSKGRLQPVLETIKYVVGKGKWLELTTLLVPHYLDNQQLRAIAEWIAGEVGDFIPWHISRFFPYYKAYNLPPTPIQNLLEAYRIGKEVGLKYVYLGNVPLSDYESTFCPSCGEILIRRERYSIIIMRIQKGKCPKCGVRIEGVWS